MAVTVHFFGDFLVDVDGRPIERWGAGRARTLFQYLLLNRGRIVPREQLHETLWPGSTWSPSASSLKVAVHAVRQAVRECAADPTDPPVRIVSRNKGYAVHVDELWLDVDEFERHIDEGRHAEENGQQRRALAAYHDAAALYTGDFLTGETGHWATGQRECGRAHALYALSYLRADAMRRSDHPEVITLCQRILDIDPYHEETYQTLILVHGRRGELGQVRNWHRICVRRLLDDLDVTPTETTRRIFSRAVRGELRALPAV